MNHDTQHLKEENERYASRLHCLRVSRFMGMICAKSCILHIITDPFLGGGGGGWVKDSQILGKARSLKKLFPLLRAIVA